MKSKPMVLLGILVVLILVAATVGIALLLSIDEPIAASPPDYRQEEDNKNLTNESQAPNDKGSVQDLQKEIEALQDLINTLKDQNMALAYENAAQAEQLKNQSPGGLQVPSSLVPYKLNTHTLGYVYHYDTTYDHMIMLVGEGYIPLPEEYHRKRIHIDLSGPQTVGIPIHGSIFNVELSQVDNQKTTKLAAWGYLTDVTLVMDLSLYQTSTDYLLTFTNQEGQAFSLVLNDIDQGLSQKVIITQYPFEDKAPSYTVGDLGVGIMYNGFAITGLVDKSTEFAMIMETEKWIEGYLHTYDTLSGDKTYYFTSPYQLLKYPAWYTFSSGARGRVQYLKGQIDNPQDLPQDALKRLDTEAFVRVKLLVNRYSIWALDESDLEESIRIKK